MPRRYTTPDPVLLAQLREIVESARPMEDFMEKIAMKLEKKGIDLHIMDPARDTKGLLWIFCLTDRNHVIWNITIRSPGDPPVYDRLEVKEVSDAILAYMVRNDPEGQRSPPSTAGSKPGKR